MDKLKTGIFVMLVGIVILGMTASSVSAAKVFTDITGDVEDKEGDCGSWLVDDSVLAICESHILPGGHVDATAEAKSTYRDRHDKEQYTFYYGWPYRIMAYAHADRYSAYASVCRY